MSEIWVADHIIYIGGASNTTDLMRRNEISQLFDDKKNVCTVLDGDQKQKYSNQENIFFSPFLDIEDECLTCFKNGDFDAWGDFSEENLRNPKMYNIQREPAHNDYSKSIWKMLIKHKCKTKIELFDHLSDKKSGEVSVFSEQIKEFLG